MTVEYLSFLASNKSDINNILSVYQHSRTMHVKVFVQNFYNIIKHHIIISSHIQVTYACYINNLLYIMDIIHIT